MKWMITALLTGSAIVAPSSILEEPSVLPTTDTPTQVAIYGDIFPSFEEYHRAQVEAHKLAKAERRAEKMSRAIDKVVERVGKTPYVMSGSSPSGWDCSGLVVWMYSKLGIELPHSASAQLYVGKRTNHPVPGDIVVWGGGYHSGIYLGKGKVVNALNSSRDTNIIHVDYLGGAVTFIRVY